MTAPPAELLASWAVRAGAFAVDMLPGCGVLATMALLALTSPADGWLRWLFIGVGATTMVAMALNRLALPGATGSTLGRALFGIAVRRNEPSASGGRVGPRRLMVRESAHLLDSLAMFTGWLWPLWDRRRRTLADLIAGTVVCRVGLPKSSTRRVVAGVLIVSATLCLTGTGLAYVRVYRQERAVKEAQVQIAEQGPRIVEQMLSYSAKTLPADFARAQALTTDGYRPQLIAQQQAVENAGAATNEFWEVSGAVLPNPPVTAGTASMLLAMQGRRGSNLEDLRFITATVRADFDKTADGQWRVADLTFLKKPQMNPAGR